MRLTVLEKRISLPAALLGAATPRIAVPRVPRSHIHEIRAKLVWDLTPSRYSCDKRSRSASLIIGLRSGCSTPAARTALPLLLNHFVSADKAGGRPGLVAPRPVSLVTRRTAGETIVRC
jgi:hypothetical protein